MAEDVLVIGAGPAGIACAYYLENANLSYKIVDQAEEIASTWNSLYPSLRLNTTRFFSHLPEAKFPLHFGMFPTGKQYHRYVTEYAISRNFNIHLGIKVTCAYPEKDGWRVHWYNTDRNITSHWFPVIISATGRFNAPIQPHFPGEGQFNGEIIHTSRYIDPKPYIGKRVMIVGNGPSGLDIATELSDYVKQPLLLSQRTGVILKPRYPLGMPKHFWMMVAEQLPRQFGNWLMTMVSKQRYRDVAKAGIKVPDPDQMSSAAGGARGRTVINAARAGKIKSVAAPVQFHIDSVELTDGNCIHVDVVIMATGYRPVLYDYLDIEDQVEHNQYDWPKRVNEPEDIYWQGDREVIGFPGLYLVGIYYQGKGAMYNFNVEAEAAVREIKAQLNNLQKNTQ